MNTKYHTIYQNWLQKDVADNNNVFTIHAETYRLHLKLADIISQREAEQVKAEISNEAKNHKLFLEIMPAKGDKGLKKLRDLLEANGDEKLLSDFRSVQGLRDPNEKMWGDVPVENLCFVGRASTTELIKSRFDEGASKTSRVIVVVCGLGGVGKTQAAADFVYKIRSSYKRIVWITASEASCESSFIKLAEELNFTEKTVKANIERVKDWFEKRVPCLVVFDDAANYDQIASYLPKCACHILITSRFNNWLPSQVNRCFALDVFSDEEAKSYMHNMLAQKMTLDDEDLSRLTSKLGHLPLALSQACGYIRECCWRISDYIKDLEKQLKLSTALEMSTVLPAVFATWSITREAIKNKSPVADRLLSICAYLQPDAVPTFLLKDAVGLLDIPMNEDDSEFSKAMRTLTNFSLLNHTEKQDQVSIHCLLQAAIRHQQRSEEKRNLTLLTRSLISSYPKGRTITDIRNMRQLLPHLSAAAETVNRWNDSQPKDKLQVELIMRLLEKKANAFYEMGITKGATNLLENLLKMKTDQFHFHHPEVASTLVYLGLAYKSLGDTKKAKELYERALVIQEEHFGPDHPEVAVTLTNLGLAYDSLGDTKKAKELYERALVIKEEHFGPDHPQVAVTLTNLGNAYYSLGDTKKAKELYERALVIKEEHFGPDHPQVAATLGNLGIAYKSLGDTKKAKELYERALVIQEEHFGPDHPQVAVTLTNLGLAYDSLGDTKKAKELYERALVINEEHFGPDHPEVAVTLGNLGAAYYSLGDTKKAKELYERALVINEEHFGPDHPQVAVTLGNLGAAYYSLGDAKTGTELVEKSFKILSEHFGAEHSETSWAKQWLQSKTKWKKK